MSVTDGSLTTDGAQQTVRIAGTVTTTTTGGSSTVTANQGTAAAIANAWPIKVTDGTNSVNVAVPSPNLGAALEVSTGTLIAFQTINALSASGPGVVSDLGAAKAQVSMVFSTTAGISAGAVALEVSQDNINWFRTSTPVTLTASTVGAISVTGAYRYARGYITTTVTGGTVSATIQGA